MTHNRKTKWAAKDRAAKKRLGLVRRELHCHPDDWPAIKAYAAELQLKRAPEDPPRMQTAVTIGDLQDAVGRLKKTIEDM